jgi:hypothetical protein
LRLALLAACAALGACTLLVDPDRSRLETVPPCEGDLECDDGLYCNGPETCNGGICVHASGEPCDDSVNCTLDFCNEDTHRCNNEVRDERCSQDPIPQMCDAVDGCVPAT